MSYTYYPDAYRFVLHGGDVRLFTAWAGGFAGGDAWRVSSQVVGIEKAEDSWRVTTESGSVYTLQEKEGRLTAYTEGVYSELIGFEHITPIKMYEAINLLEKQ
jgi:hypothetical protein